jgi:hypothetical protein
MSAGAQAGLRLREGCGREQDCEQDCRLHMKTLVDAVASFVSYAEHASSLEWYIARFPCQVGAGAIWQGSSHECPKDPREDAIPRAGLCFELGLELPLLRLAGEERVEALAGGPVLSQYDRFLHVVDG